LATLYAHVHQEPPKPRWIQPELTQKIEQALLIMLSKFPGERYECCVHFLMALTEPPIPETDDELAVLYERLLKKVADHDWHEALEIGSRIQMSGSIYLDVVEQTDYIREVLSLPFGDTWVNPKTGKEMLRVSAGPFLFGENKERRVLPDFWIDKTPVTNEEYAHFVLATGHESPYHWKVKKKSPAELADHPVVNVSQQDAIAYSKWAEGNLPSEEQWEKAARGVDGREYPWGDLWEENLCNTEEIGIGNTTQVGSFSPRGDSPTGCIDMSGNVWEWVYTRKNGYLIFKGGSFHSNKERARASIYGGYPFFYAFDRGFRMVIGATLPASNILKL
jgi:hypothetical protein